jgi:ferric-dicitrate binding protein FerR (iron transport regulator)
MEQRRPSHARPDHRLGLRGRRHVVAALAVALLAAGCGGKHNTTKPGVTASQNVTKPLQRPLIVHVGQSTVTLRRASASTTRVTVDHATGFVVLARGSCAAGAKLQTLKKLSGAGPWTVHQSLSALTASPLAVLVGKSCRNVPSA